MIAHERNMSMIEIILKINDKENGTPGEVCESIQQAIEAIEGKDEGWRFEVESASARMLA